MIKAGNTQSIKTYVSRRYRAIMKAPDAHTLCSTHQQGVYMREIYCALSPWFHTLNSHVCPYLCLSTFPI
jgi:hypothetical protein